MHVLAAPCNVYRYSTFVTWYVHCKCGEQITRGRPFKLRVQHCRMDARKYFFGSRVITIWNQLPAEVLNAVTVAAFVAKLRSCDLSRYLL